MVIIGLVMLLSSVLDFSVCCDVEITTVDTTAELFLCVVLPLVIGDVRVVNTVPFKVECFVPRDQVVSVLLRPDTVDCFVLCFVDDIIVVVVVVAFDVVVVDFVVKALVVVAALDVVGTAS